MKRIILTLSALFLLVGCGVNTTFVYKPGAPVTDNPRFPAKVAVVAFQDGTEDFTKRGNELFDLENTVYNMAKAGWGGVMTALTPELWAKALADELTALGLFGSVRFVYNPAEAADDDIRIEGVLEKASLVGGFIDRPNEFDLRLRAFRQVDAHPAWEKKISRKWINQRKLYDGCGPTEIQCMVDRHHADTNRVMRDMFAEAATDLMGTLGGFSESRGGADERRPLPSSAPPPDAKSVDETIENILRGQ